MSSVIQLNGTRRTRLGKGGARKARAAGQVPGVVYGHGEEPVPVAVRVIELSAAAVATSNVCVPSHAPAH